MPKTPKTACKYFKEVSSPIDENLDILTDGSAFHCELGHKLKDEFVFAFTCCCNDGGTDRCSDFSAIYPEVEIIGSYPGIEQDYSRAADMIQCGDSDSILRGFMFLCDIFKKSQNRQVCEEIINMHKQAEEISHSNSVGTNGKITARTIILMYDKFASEMRSDITFRSCQTGKTPEQLHEDDEAAAAVAERKRLQSDAWRSQGLCYSCGGQLNILKKCKSCRTKN